MTILLAALLVAAAPTVQGHGYLAEPPSRMLLAYANTGAGGAPGDYCPHCNSSRAGDRDKNRTVRLLASAYETRTRAGARPRRPTCLCKHLISLETRTRRVRTLKDVLYPYCFFFVPRDLPAAGGELGSSRPRRWPRSGCSPGRRREADVLRSTRNTAGPLGRRVRAVRWPGGTRRLPRTGLPWC